MVTSALMSSRNLLYRMAYENSMCLFLHSMFVGFYYFLDVRPYFVSVFISTFLIMSYLPILDVMVLCVLSPITISAYDFLFPISSYFTFMVDSTISTFPTRSLVAVGPISNVSICFHPTITPRNFTNIYPCKTIVNKFTSMCYLLYYTINMVLSLTRSFTKKHRI